MKKLIITAISLLIILPASLHAGGVRAPKYKCDTKFPILLLHGVMLRDKTLGYNYFGRIPSTLADEGATVYQGNQQAWSTHEDNAEMLRKKILYITDALGHGKVNILAHSKGALEIRVMIAKYPAMKSKISSFTSIAGPHRGSVLADLLFGVVPPFAQKFLTDMVNVIGYIQGDPNPNSMGAGLSLTRANMAEMNAILADVAGDKLSTGIPGIYCQSYASKIKGLIPDLMLQTTGVVMSLAGERENDGAVAVSSAKYANFRGVISGAWWCGGVSHFANVDRGIGLFAGLTPGFDARIFYVDMVKELKNKGF